MTGTQELCTVLKAALEQAHFSVGATGIERNVDFNLLPWDNADTILVEDVKSNSWIGHIKIADGVVLIRAIQSDYLASVPLAKPKSLELLVESLLECAP